LGYQQQPALFSNTYTYDTKAARYDVNDERVSAIDKEKIMRILKIKKSSLIIINRKLLLAILLAIKNSSKVALLTVMF
jgi:hypothetical protein